MPPKRSGSDGDTNRVRSRPPKLLYASNSNSLGESAQTTTTQQPSSTPASNAGQAQEDGTTGRRTRRSSGPLMEMRDNPDRIMRGASKTPSRRSNVARNNSAESSQGHRPSVIVPYNPELSIVEEEENDRGGSDIADIPVPSTEHAGWTDSDFEVFGEQVPNHESIVSISPRLGRPRNSSSSHSSSGHTSVRQNSSHDSPSQRRYNHSERRDISDSGAGQSPFGTNLRLLHVPPQQTEPGFPLPPPQRRLSPLSEVETTWSSRSSGGPHLLPLEGVGEAPSPDDLEGSSSERDLPQLSSPGRRLFFCTLWEQMAAGMLYFSQEWWYVSLALAIILLGSVLCSADPTCKSKHWLELILIYASSSPWECFCIVIVYSLMIAGLIDSGAAIGETLEKIGERAAQQQKPLFKDWRRFFGRPVAYFKGYIAPILADVVNVVSEPVLVLALTIALRDCWWLAFGMDENTSPAFLAFFVSWNLHCLKWICQTCEILWDVRENIPGLMWVRKPVVLLLLIFLLVISIFHNWDVVPPMIHGPAVARAYYNSDMYPRTGNQTTISIASWITRPTKEAATPAYRVTQILVTSGVLPTMERFL